MAEGTSKDSEKLVCPFFKQNSCRKGDRCHLSHDSHPSNFVCSYYLKGNCLFGDNCWNRHSKSPNRHTPKDSVTVLPTKDNKPSQVNNLSKSDLGVKEMESHVAGPSQLSCEESNFPGNIKRPFQQSNKCKLLSFSRESENQLPLSCAPNTPNWVHAPEFIPKTVKSYADTLKTHLNLPEPEELPVELCPFYMNEICPYDGQCPYVHGDICELCGKACLHPFDDSQRKIHIDLCEKELENDMEHAFAMQRSEGKMCGICMDVILEKDPPSERRFGILEKCNHVFCLACIRKWRSVKQFESHVDISPDSLVTRSCPECRVTSNFITPSQYWYDSEEDKKKLIDAYKIAMSKKPCKYFQRDNSCPFGGSCFYLHAKADGSKVDLPPPVRRRRQNQDGELDFVDRIFLWDFLEFRDENILMQLDDILHSLSADTDEDSDISDNFFLNESF